MRQPTSETGTASLRRRTVTKGEAVRGVAGGFVALLLAAGSALAQPTGETVAPRAGPWSFQAITYLWLPEIEGRVGARGLGAEVDVDFDRMLDLLGDGDLLAGGGHFEARYDRVSFFVDAFGGTARPSKSVTFGPRASLDGVADLTMNFTFVEFGPAYRVLDWPRGGEGRPIMIDLLTGGRFMYFYESLTLEGSRGLVDRFVKSTSTWVDPFVGGRFAVPLVGGLDLIFRGDIGGFGAGSQLAWNLIGGFNYGLPWRPFGAQTSVVAVYKALDFDYESGSDEIELALDLRGPALGLAFEF